MTLNDRSGTITTGGVSQQAAPPNIGRVYLFVQNQSAGDLWIDFGVAATQGQPSVRIPAGASLLMREPVSVQSIHIIGADANQPFVLKDA